MSLWRRLTERAEWRFFATLHRADRRLGVAWWGLLGARSVLPALLAIAMGVLVGAVTRGGSLAGPLAFAGSVFVLMQVLPSVHTAVGANLGDRMAAWLNDRLLEATVRPAGMGHLEDPELAKDMTAARDFDLGIHGPPLSIAMDFIAKGLVLTLGGVASALVLFGFAWWAPFVLLGAWFASHWLLRESGVWRDRNTDAVRAATQEADYAFRLAVEAPPAKEIRLFGLADWVVDRFVERRRHLYTLRHEATRLRERPLVWSLLLVLAANALVLAFLGLGLVHGTVALGAAVAFAQAAVSTGAVAFGGLDWSLDGAAAPVAAVYRLAAATGPAGALAPAPNPTEARGNADGLPAREIRFRGVSFRYPGADSPLILDGFDLTIPAGSSLAIVGRNGAGKTTLAKLLCRLYDPVAGAIEVDGRDLRSLDVAAWRSRVTAVFQDYLRLELPLRDNVAPRGGDEGDVRAALALAGAEGLTSLDTPLAKGYPGGTDLSGGQWQRVALARALFAVRQGAGVVLLDEPTAQLDVRGEAEIFERLLAATRSCTTILVSHRFSTVRQADRICVLEAGRVVELGSHEELMALDGRYRTMFDLQAQRFAAGLPEDEDEDEVAGVGW
ncbi:MAG TPA: ATP-binding cassette domain-containing protein [Micromonosporaceae bacterium]